MVGIDFITIVLSRRRLIFRQLVACNIKRTHVVQFSHIHVAGRYVVYMYILFERHPTQLNELKLHNLNFCTPGGVPRMMLRT